ncbi:MAG: hypothetical protein LW863_13610 [Flammeovirgaceae bacterium]|nr:hypothetical protein [Flammeovirgaceae bacterium]
MKSRLRFIVMMAVMALVSFEGFSQKVDEERMQRDIEVAENILSTLLKQQYEKRSCFPIEVSGSYRAGYGVTFTMPNIQSNIYFGTSDGSFGGFNSDGITIIETTPENDAAQIADGQRKNNRAIVRGGAARAPLAKKGSAKVDRDSVKDESSQRNIKAAKDFIADYGDLIGQLAPNERIIVTNRSEGDYMWFGSFDNQSNSLITVEGVKSDILQYKQGKMTREQLMAKIKVVNSERDTELQPDLELLTSIFNRLYRSDLSKTYFTQENTYYERLKDFGVIYHMQVYSSNQQDVDNWRMPTLSLEDVDQATRDKKVKELYPLFTKSIKEDILEYGRTLRSLKDDENLIFDIRMTRCRGCGIPSSLEYTIKYSVLKDYASGKITKEAALGKISEKKGEEQ